MPVPSYRKVNIASIFRDQSADNQAVNWDGVIMTAIIISDYLDIEESGSIRDGREKTAGVRMNPASSKPLSLPPNEGRVLIFP